MSHRAELSTASDPNWWLAATGIGTKYNSVVIPSVTCVTPAAARQLAANRARGLTATLLAINHVVPISDRVVIPYHLERTLRLQVNKNLCITRRR